MKKFKRALSAVAACLILGSSMVTFTGCSGTGETIVLRVCNWEEYIDLGDWGEDELIDIENPFG